MGKRGQKKKDKKRGGNGKKETEKYKGQEGLDGSGSGMSNGKEAGRSKGQEEHNISRNRGVGTTRCPADRGMKVF